MTARQELWRNVRDPAKRLSFFITALVPAWVILLIRCLFSADANPLVCLLLLVPIAVVPAVVVRHLRHTASANNGLVNITVKEKFDITGDVALYALTYIPLVFIEDLTPEHMLVLATILAVVYAMYTKFNLLHINPIISMFYRTYRVVDNHGNTTVVFSKLKVRSHSNLRCLEISENLYVVATDDL